MTKLIHFLFFSLFAFGSLQLHGTATTRTIVLHTHTDETVGSLFATEIGNGKCLLIPDVLCLSNDYTQLTKSPLYATRAGKIPMQSFVNFIEQSHILFDEYDKQTAYQNALKRAIKAHKNFYCSKKRSDKSTTIAHQTLLDAEIQVFRLLDTIKLSPEIIKTLERILSIPKRATFFEKLKSLISHVIEKVIWIITAAWRNFFGWGLGYFLLSALLLFIPSLMYATDSPHATFANWIPFHLIFTIPWLVGGILYGGMLALFYSRRNGYLKKQILPLKEPEIQVAIASP